MIIKVMIDTNIIISGMLFNGPERKLLNYASEKKFILVLSEFSLREARMVFKRKFPEKEKLLDEVISVLPVKIIPLPSLEKVKEAEKIIRDRKDAFILATAMEIEPNIFVSGDKDFHTDEVKKVMHVVSTGEALALFM